MLKQYDFTWNFPLPRTHTGMLAGNGTLGVMVWGEGNVLRVTLGRADWWDHRGGSQWTPDKSFATIRQLLEAGDASGMEALFASNRAKAGDPERPSVLPIGRVELIFAEDVVLSTGQLDRKQGIITVNLQGKINGQIRILSAMDSPVVALDLDAAPPLEAIRQVPAWDCLGDYLASISFAAPESFGSANDGGWIQTTPCDEVLAVAVRRTDKLVAMTAVTADSGAAASAMAGALVERTTEAGFGVLQQQCTAWWKDYWRTVPRLAIPNKKLQFLYDYGMYKFAILTNPAGVAATLQGPWVEDYQMPPWSNDYHFNINVQMCYWPAYRGNRLQNLKPLFELIASWQSVLTDNARCFLGIDDGVMLPHAVDDRCTTIGSFWTGTIDHGCTAWVAQMMFDYYRYTLDETFLRDTAFPFMSGAMRVYEEMLEEDGAGGLVLPVSVSPEYGGADMKAWGRNASFQLACIHMLAEHICAAAEVLGTEPRSGWLDIRQRLPKASLYGPSESAQIGLWDGQELAETHRHHSHLGAICPFDVLDPDDPTWGPILERSIARWIYRGPGLWSGWCVPWAAMLHLRFGNADMAEILLEILDRVFTNEGHGTRHNGFISGFTLMGVGPAGGRPENEHEIMQMDAGMSAVAAIMEMMLYSQRGIHHVFRGVPAHWQDVSFGPMRAEGAFMVSGERCAGEIRDIRIESLAGGIFKLANPWAGTVAVARSGGGSEVLEGPVLTVSMTAGETLTLSPTSSSA